jgi:hypothetical protein
MRHGEKRGNASTHGIAHNVGALDLEMVEQAAPVFGHRRRAIKRRIVQLLALTMPSIVIGDHPAPSCGERADPPWVDPIGRHIGGKAMDKKNRFALPLVDIGDLHAVGIEPLWSHLSLCLRGHYARRYFSERETET